MTAARQVADKVRGPVNRRVLLAVIGGLVILLAASGTLTGLLLYQQDRSNELGVQAGRNAAAASKNNTAARKLRDQVVSLGGTPVAQPSAAPAQPGSRGPAGRSGVRGDVGRRGPRGFTGQSGRDGRTPACVNTSGGCVGPQGEPGSDGQDGETVVGPQGPAGQDGESVQGPQGPPGQDGASVQGPPGEPGTDGRDGVSVTGQHFERNPDGVCVSVVDYSDGRHTSQQAGDAACPPAQPAPTAEGDGP